MIYTCIEIVNARQIKEDTGIQKKKKSEQTKTKTKANGKRDIPQQDSRLKPTWVWGSNTKDCHAICQSPYYVRVIAASLPSFRLYLKQKAKENEQRRKRNLTWKVLMVNIVSSGSMDLVTTSSGDKSRFSGWFRFVQTYIAMPRFSYFDVDVICFTLSFSCGYYAVSSVSVSVAT